MEAEARDILLTALDADRPVDLAWIDRLVAVGEELGGSDLPEPDDDTAPAASFAR